MPDLNPGASTPERGAGGTEPLTPAERAMYNTSDESGEHEPTDAELEAMGYMVPRDGTTIPTRRQIADLIQEIVVDAGGEGGTVSQPLAEHLAQYLDAIYSRPAPVVPTGDAPLAQRKGRTVLRDAIRKRLADAYITEEIWYAMDRVAREELTEIMEVSEGRIDDAFYGDDPASGVPTGGAPTPSDRVLGLRFVTDPAVPPGEVQLRDKGRVVARLINVDDGEIVTGSRVEAPVPSGTSREIIERAHRFAWAYGSHRSPCPLATDINAPDSTVCTCGYDRDADALMDDEDALGMDFWKVARANSAASARADAPADDETLNTGDGETWLTAEQERARDLNGALLILTDPTSSEHHERAAADRVKRIFNQLESRLTAARADAPTAGLSVICRECGTLTAGEEAGDRVRWVTCQSCAAARADREDAERWRALVKIAKDLDYVGNGVALMPCTHSVTHAPICDIMTLDDQDGSDLGETIGSGETFDAALTAAARRSQGGEPNV